MKRARVERDLEAAVRGYQVSQLSDVLAAWQQRCGVGRTGDEARQDTREDGLRSLFSHCCRGGRLRADVRDGDEDQCATYHLPGCRNANYQLRDMTGRLVACDG